MRCMEWIKAIRPVNVVLVFFTVLLGAALCGCADNEAIIAGISAALILAGGNLFNDAVDIPVDRISHPERPAAAGKLSKSACLWGAGILFSGGIAVSLYLPTSALIVAVVAVAALVLYSLVLVRLPLIGNFVIAGLSALAAIFGALASCSVCTKTVWMAVIAGLLHLPREIFKDVQDYDGDLAVGRKTLPILLGKQKSSHFAVGACAVAMIAIVAPYLGGVFSDYYLSAAFVPFVLVGVAAVFGERGYPHTAQKYLKFAMLFGLVALFVEFMASR